MSNPLLSIGRIERQLSAGGTEFLQFEQGVNLLVGPPNTGKTKWLQTLDYLLGDSDPNPFDAAENGLDEKYQSAAAEILIGQRRLWVERRWRELGNKTKVFVDEVGMSTKEFQHLLMEELQIPIVNYPKGNPMSGQTWPELSFRTLLRHVYRQQRFWGAIADKQHDHEQHACLLQFLGLAEHLFSEKYGRLVELKMKADKKKARRDQYSDTLNELARDVLSDPGLTVGVNQKSVRSAESRISESIDSLRNRRVSLIAGAKDKVVAPGDQSNVQRLADERASKLVAHEQHALNSKVTQERLLELQRYRDQIQDELDRLRRAEDAGMVLADLKITHCPACDQPVSEHTATPAECFLCHQGISDSPIVQELGSARLEFETKRLLGEVKEADELVAVVQKEVEKIAQEIALNEERLRTIENEITPAKLAVSAMIQEDVSAIDMELGELSERQRQLSRVSAAMALGEKLSEEILDIERKIEPLQAFVDEAARKLDFGSSASRLEDGMNAYLSAINHLRPGVWRHSPITVDISRRNFSFRVGSRRWQSALGGTDSLYFLMAYHYGLLSLSATPGLHYPGVSIIDVPGEFAGEAVEDKENFIVQPFVELMSESEDFADAQLIITGASFTGLQGAKRIHLSDVYIA